MTKISPGKQIEPDRSEISGLVTAHSEVHVERHNNDWQPQRDAENTREAIDQLTSVFAAYNETTERMNLAYRQLQAEIARLRSELQQKNEQLQRKSRLAALGEMAAGMAHEIRNPLGGVQLYASLLERDLIDQKDKLKWARKISKGVQSLDLIVSDILAFTNEQSCNKTSVNLLDLLNEITDYVEPRIDNIDVQLDLSGVNPQLSVAIDVNMMQRVLLNLILNAVDAVEPKGRIFVRADACDDEPDYRMRIAVGDDGPGIDPQVMGRIFNPFFTTKDTGTGLGLAIVHRLIECHGGVISAVNNDDGGATFSILLP